MDRERSDGRQWPRDRSGSVDLQGGTGGITAMCPVGDVIEVYKVDRTFRINDPDSIDPERTYPDAPFVASPTDTIGSANPVVARCLLQGEGIMRAASFERDVDEKQVIRILHECKESLVACWKVGARVSGHVDTISTHLQSTGLPLDPRGRAVTPFPQVPDLDADATMFLIQAKRAIAAMCRLPPQFVTMKSGDNNFDSLAKSLEAVLNPASHPVVFVKAHRDGVRRLIELRNHQEHPHPVPTIVANFRVLPDSSTSAPVWYVREEAPTALATDMQDSVMFLTEMVEGLLMSLVLHAMNPELPLVIEELEPGQINEAVPIRYRVTLAAHAGRVWLPGDRGR